MTGTSISRRGFLGGLAAAAVVGVAGCGGNTGRSGSSGSGSGNSGGGASSGASGAAGGSSGSSGATISQWYHQYGEAGTEQAVKRYAAAYTKAKVSVQWIPGDYDKKSAAALLTSSGPDVFEYGNGPTIDMIKGGQVVDLTDAIGDAKSDFTPSLIDRVTYNGKIWAIPQVTDMQLLVYRKSLLQKAGVQPPQTLDQLISAAKALTTKKVKGLFVGNAGGADVLGGPIIWSSGADYLTPDGKFGFDNPNVYDGMRKLHQLFTSGSLLLGAPTDWSDPSAITQGLTAMQWTGLWNVPALQKALGDDFAVLPFPANGSVGKPSVPVGAYGSCVSAKARDVAASKDFVKWLWVDRTDFQEDFATSYGFHIPARKSIAEKATKLKTGVAADAVKFVNDYGHAQTPILWTPATGSAFNDAMSRIVKNGSDPKKEIVAVKAKATAEVARIKG